MLTTMANTAIETGQTLSLAPGRSLADAFLAMVKKTELMVDGEGKISWPQLHCSKEIAEKIDREIEERGPEFKKLLEEARQEKEQQALAKEAERLARYDSSE
jgi:hypothetical protein